MKRAADHRLVYAPGGRLECLQVDPSTTVTQALSQASCILSGLDDLLDTLAEGEAALKGDGYFALGVLASTAKALIDAADMPIESSDGGGA